MAAGIGMAAIAAGTAPSDTAELSGQSMFGAADVQPVADHAEIGGAAAYVAALGSDELNPISPLRQVLSTACSRHPHTHQRGPTTPNPPAEAKLRPTSRVASHFVPPPHTLPRSHTQDQLDHLLRETDEGIGLLEEMPSPQLKSLFLPATADGGGDCGDGADIPASAASRAHTQRLGTRAHPDRLAFAPRPTRDPRDGAFARHLLRAAQVDFDAFFGDDEYGVPAQGKKRSRSGTGKSKKKQTKEAPPKCESIYQANHSADGGATPSMPPPANRPHKKKKAKPAPPAEPAPRSPPRLVPGGSRGMPARRPAEPVEPAEPAAPAAPAAPAEPEVCVGARPRLRAPKAAEHGAPKVSISAPMPPPRKPPPAMPPPARAAPAKPSSKAGMRAAARTLSVSATLPSLPSPCQPDE